MQKINCTKCRGRGSFLPPESFVTDWKTCHICKGSGFLPENYKVKKDTKQRRRTRYVRKTDGLDGLKEVSDE